MFPVRQTAGTPGANRGPCDAKRVVTAFLGTPPLGNRIATVAECLAVPLMLDG